MIWILFNILVSIISIINGTCTFHKQIECNSCNNAISNDITNNINDIEIKGRNMNTNTQDNIYVNKI